MLLKVMMRYDASVPEAMTIITRARLKRAKRTLTPSRRIIDLLHNESYLRQLDMWRACDYNIYENVVLNPNEPREKWIVEKITENPGKEE